MLEVSDDWFSKDWGEHPWSLKIEAIYQAYKAGYDEVVELDNDVVVRTDAPWLLQYVKHGTFAACRPPMYLWGGRYSARKWHETSWKWSKIVLPGMPMWPVWGHLNGGVWAYRPAEIQKKVLGILEFQKDWLERRAKYACKLWLGPDETAMSAFTYSGQLPLTVLPQQTMGWRPKDFKTGRYHLQNYWFGHYGNPIDTVVARSIERCRWDLHHALHPEMKREPA